MGIRDAAMDQSSSGQDGSRAKWFTVLTMWTRDFVIGGILKGLGILLPTLKDQFGTTTWVIGWISSMIIIMQGLVSPFTVLLSGQFKTGTVVVVCGTMISVASIAGSFATSALQLALTFTVLAGIGFGIINVRIKESVGRCFTKNHATAVGIARTGYSVGLFVCAPLVQLFLKTYGWRGALLLAGGISMHLIVCGALLVKTEAPRASNYQQLPDDESYSLRQETSVTCSGCVAFWKYIFRNLDLTMLRNFRFWLVVLTYCSTHAAFDLWVIYFVSRAQSIGISMEDATTIVTVASVGLLVGNVGQGPIVDRGVISSWSMMVVAVSTTCASYWATPWMTSYWPVMIVTVVMLTGIGSLISLNDVMTKQLLGEELLAGAYGWMGIADATLMVSLGFVPGLIYDTTGSYDGAFIFMGFVQFVSMNSLLTVKYFKLV